MNQQSGIFDTLIIGGGINGAGIAADAASRGLRVALCEQNDLASATSSSSSKLIHGGLRYLESYEFSLVRKALKESELLLHLAPHIMAPISINIPHLSHHRPWWLIRLGLFFYNNLASRPSYVSATSVNFDQNSPLRSDIKRGFSFSDAQVDDARLVILNALQAASKSAEIFVRHQCIRIRAVDDYWEAVLHRKADGQEITLNTRTIVNATGPWVSDLTAELANTSPRHQVRLIKGSHIIIPRIEGQENAYLLQNEDSRVVFVIPYLKDYTLIGTTEEEFSGDLEDVNISEQETDYLIEIVNQYFTHQISRQSIVSCYAGIRPIMDNDQTSASKASRDFRLEYESSRLPFLSVYGGKVTTYRLLARKAVDELCATLNIDKSSNTRETKLPGAGFTSLQSLQEELLQQYSWIPAKLLDRWVHSYGSLSFDIISGASCVEDLGLEFGHGLYQCEVDYLIAKEWASTQEDILWRRTKLGLKFDVNQVASLSDYLTDKLT